MLERFTVISVLTKNMNTILKIIKRKVMTLLTTKKPMLKKG